MTAHGTLRWGDVESLENIGALTALESNAVLSRQLVAAHWRWPLNWVMRIALVPLFDASETGTFVANVLVTLGTGGGLMEFPLRYVITPTSGVYLPVTDAQFLPAQDIQARIKVTGDAKLSGGRDDLQVGCWVAPQTEAHAPTHMLELMTGERKVDNVEWMPEGFTPEELRYGPSYRR